MNRALDRSLLAVTLIAVASYGVADENVGLLLVGLVGVLTSWIVVRARSGEALPVSVTLALTLAAVGYAMIRLVGEGFRVGVFSEFVLALIVVKLLDRRSRRDNAQVLLLSVFLVVGAILTSNRLLLAILLLAFIPVICTAVVRHQIIAARELASGTALFGPRAPHSREAVDLRRLVWVSSSACACISVVIFVVMPRGVGMQAFGAWGNTSLGQVTSFADEVELGRGGLISQSSTPVLDLEVRNARGEVQGSASEVFYLRGSVLDQYDNGRWTRRRDNRGRLSQRSAVFVDANSPYSVGPNEPETDLELRITIRNAKQGESHLFSTWRPIKFMSHAPTRIKHDPGDGTIIREGPSGKFEYVIYSRGLQSSFQQRRSARTPPSFDSQRITDLTRQLLEASPEPVNPNPYTRSVVENVQIVGLIENYLVGNYSYSLETRSAPPGEDPIEWFLFGEDKRGHCEYFASAMAAMCRSVGINARVITGYVATEWNAPTGHYIVRESNAHAWVEVEVKPDLWRPQDPTPTSDLNSIHAPSRSLLARARRLLDTAEYAWINSVVGFNRRSRSSMMDSSLDGAVSGWSQRVVERVRTGGVGLALKAGGAGFVAFALTMMTGLLVVWARGGTWRAPALWSVLRGLLRRAPVRRRAAAHESLHAQLVRTLQQAGAPKPDWRPIGAHSRRPELRDMVGPDTPEGTALTRVIRAIYLERFGGKRPDRKAMLEARSDLDVLVGGIRERARARSNAGRGSE